MTVPQTQLDSEVPQGQKSFLDSDLLFESIYIGVQISSGPQHPGLSICSEQHTPASECSTQHLFLACLLCARPCAES